MITTFPQNTQRIKLSYCITNIHLENVFLRIFNLESRFSKELEISFLNVQYTYPLIKYDLK